MAGVDQHTALILARERQKQVDLCELFVAGLIHMPISGQPEHHSQILSAMPLPQKKLMAGVLLL